MFSQKFSFFPFPFPYWTQLDTWCYGGSLFFLIFKNVFKNFFIF